jgi:hypothetical protein
MSLNVSLEFENKNKEFYSLIELVEWISYMIKL